MAEVAPTQEDPLLAHGSELIGGPAGRNRRMRTGWWSPLRVLIMLSALGYGIGIWLGSSCRTSAWSSPERYEHLCYTDIHPFYTLNGLAEGAIPYLDISASHQLVDSPVLVGMFMQISALITRGITAIAPDASASTVFFEVNVVLLFVALLVVVIATALAARNRPWDAAMVALAPMMILAARINWDLLAVALVALALLQLTRNRSIATGVLLGAAMAAAHYPVVVLFALVVCALRTKQVSSTGRMVLAAVISWLVINLPIIVLNFDGWSAIYRKMLDSGPELGSVWFALAQWGGPLLSARSVTLASALLFLAALAAITALVLHATVPPRAASVIFLVVAAYALTAKGFSPQFGIWLIPLAVLARPRWRDFLIWQGAEVVYFIAVWWYLAGYEIAGAKGLSAEWYAFATLVHVAGTLFFVAMVIRDMVKPQADPVRLTTPNPVPHQSVMS
ncbi:MAG: hypothetical protein Q7K25_11210 [Actinomycetota bacterium]|nr:hypothetical protein [Actinomycetota bacterium]